MDAKSFTRYLRANTTDAERLLWSRLRRRQLAGFRFRRQRPFGPYVCDFVCLEASLVIEVDGSQHVADRQHDEARDALFRSHGYRVLRFWNGDVLSRTESVVDTIFAALDCKRLDGRLE